MSDNKQGFDTLALHAGYDPDPTINLGLGQGAPTGIPVYRTTPYKFKNTEHAANLFKLKELGNIYSRIMNPTNSILESRYAQLEGTFAGISDIFLSRKKMIWSLAVFVYVGGHPLSGLAVSSGTNAIFYAIINLASEGDNIVAARALYGGTFTMFNDILPKFGIQGEYLV